jgi:hypothetical protein
MPDSTSAISDEHLREWIQQHPFLSTEDEDKLARRQQLVRQWINARRGKG